MGNGFEGETRAGSAPKEEYTPISNYEIPIDYTRYEKLIQSKPIQSILNNINPLKFNFF